MTEKLVYEQCKIKSLNEMAKLKVNANILLYAYSRLNNFSILNKLLVSWKKYTAKNEMINYDYGLRGACENGNLKILNFMIKKGAENWNLGLFSACEGNQIEMITLMIEKGANNWNWGLKGACYGKHESIVKMMILKGANDWNLCLRAACFSGNENIVNTLISCGATNFNEGLIKACDGRYLQIIKKLILCGANKLTNSYLQLEPVQLWLLYNGIKREQIQSIPYIILTFKKLDRIKKNVRSVISGMFSQETEEHIVEYLCM